MPKVTVCIPTYNMARFLPEALESALGQRSFGDYEVLVCDDASDDGTEEVARRYEPAGVRYLRFGHGGQARTANRGIAASRGEYVLILAADDALAPLYLGRATAALDADPKAGMVHCAVQHVDEAGHPFRLQRLHDRDTIDPGEDLLRRLLIEGCVVNPAGVLVRRSVYERVGGFTEAIVWGVDWHMWMRVALVADAAYLSDPLALYRHHGGTGTSQVMTSGRNARDELWLVQDVFSRIPPEKDHLRALRPEAIRRVAHRTWCHAEDVCRLGDGRAARVGLARCAEISPWMALRVRFWGLWVASFLGYRWFEKAVGWKRRLLGRGAQGGPR